MTRLAGASMLGLLLWALTLTVAEAVAGDDPRPVIAIIIDDLGNDPREARRTAALPGPITVAVLPHTPQAHNAAIWAHEHGHEVMLHLPMEADNGHDPGPGAILRHMNEYETRDTVRLALASVPHVRGVNNHMGSRLSREPHHLAWVMAEVSDTDPALYFVDSRTHAETLVRHISTWAGLPSTQRDVFLDAQPHDADFVRNQVKLLGQLARMPRPCVGHWTPLPGNAGGAGGDAARTEGSGYPPGHRQRLPHTQAGGETMARVLIPITHGSEEVEAVTLIDLLRRADFQVVVAGLEPGTVTCSRGVVLKPDVLLDEVLDDPFDLVVLPGGLPGANRLDADPRIHALLHRLHDEGRLVGAICAAPKVLGSAGLLKGRNATGHPSVVKTLDLPDTRFAEQPVVVDGNIATSQGPGTAMDFALTLIELLAGADKRREVEGPLCRPE